LPATIQAQNIDNGGQTVAYFERTIPSPNATPSNSLLQTASCGGACTGSYITSMEKNEWTQYSVTLTQPSIYNAIFKVGSTSAGGATFHLERNHINISGTLSVAQTGISFVTVAANNIALPQGTYPLRVVVESGTMIFNNIQFNFVSSTLQVNLINLKVNWLNDNGNIGWKVNEESGCANYEIYRSFDGVNFNKTGTVPCRGNNTTEDYVFIDQHVAALAGSNKIIYYRIECVEQTGVRKILGNGILKTKNENLFSIYPNPVNDQTIVSVYVTTPDARGINLRICDAAGICIVNKPIQTSAGENKILLNLSKLANGTYFASLVSPNGELIGAVQKIIK
jgi:hypothetical protein